MKQAAFGAVLVLAASAAYFYHRHNATCDPGLYSRFALCEYLLVVATILFHFTLYFDVPHIKLTFSLGDFAPGGSSTSIPVHFGQNGI